MEATKGLTNLQLELVKLFSFEVSEAQLKELKQILVEYFASKITEDLDILFEENDWDEDKIAEWSNEHMRTKYE